MSQVFEDLAAYAKRLGERPPGFHRTNRQRVIWGTEAWRCLPSNYRMCAAYGHIESLWDSVLRLLGLPSAQDIDELGFEDLSLQLYALYADMILEYLRSHGYE